jgi:hypothetical protein
MIPSTIEVLWEKCSFDCKSLSFVRCESGSSSSRVKKEMFSRLAWLRLFLRQLNFCVRMLFWMQIIFFGYFSIKNEVVRNCITSIPWDWINWNRDSCIDWILAWEVLLWVRIPFLACLWIRAEFVKNWKRAIQLNGTAKIIIIVLVIECWIVCADANSFVEHGDFEWKVEKSLNDIEFTISFMFQGIEPFLLLSGINLQLFQCIRLIFRKTEDCTFWNLWKNISGSIDGRWDNNTVRM